MYYYNIHLLNQHFPTYTYSCEQKLIKNTRVIVPLQNKQILGIVGEEISFNSLANFKIRKIIEMIDESAIISENMYKFLSYIAKYYQANLGEVFFTALPNKLLKINTSKKQYIKYCKISDIGKAEIALNQVFTKKQKEILDFLIDNENKEIESDYIYQTFRTTPNLLSKLEKNHLIDIYKTEKTNSLEHKTINWNFDLTLQTESITKAVNIKNITLNQEQNNVFQILKNRENFAVDLIFGVTGSGKTEIYLKLIQSIIDQKKGQILLLSPEIALAKMLFDRLKDRLNCTVALEHSELSNNERFKIRKQVRNAEIDVLIGTRCALFADFHNLSEIIIDECHDRSYKQQDGLRYNARDMAIVRAKIENIPIILGSATPLLESWRQVEEGKWQIHELKNRALAQTKAKISIDNIFDTQMVECLSVNLLREITRNLQQGKQVLLFLNRRGYAPKLICNDCERVENCHACDASMVVHLDKTLLICHHCGRMRKIPMSCSDCGSKNLKISGYGTQRLENLLCKLYPYAKILRIDTDSATTHKQFQKMTEQIANNEVDIIIGTQWLGKGHHFANINLVAIIAGDGAFYSSDFRSEELFAQLLVQVGGRAGREGGGHIWIQTKYPDSEVFKVLYSSYKSEAMRQLSVRKSADLPPYSAQLLVSCIHKELDISIKILQEIMLSLQKINIPWIFLGPTPAFLSKKNDEHRSHLLIQAETRNKIQQFLPQLKQLINNDKYKKNKIFIDVDPIWID